MEATSPEVESIRLELSALETKRDEIQELVKLRVSIKSGYQLEIDKVRAAANARINELNELRKKIDADIFDYNRELRELNDQIRALEQKLRLAMEAALRSAKIRNQSILFDEITAGLPWREFAFDHQMSGAKMMAANKRTINADKMGLGKTLQSLMACDMLQSERILIVAPNGIVGNFLRELKRWAPHRVPFNLSGMSKIQRNMALQVMRNVGGPVTVVVNYEAWRKDDSLIEQLIEMRFDTAILDEFHWVKNPKSNAARGLERIVLANNICPSCSGPTQERRSGIFWWTECALCSWNVRENSAWRHNESARRSIKHVFPMSGTPVLNRPDELYMALHLIIPEVFYDIEVFRTMYCVIDRDTGKYRWSSTGLNDLERHLAGHYVARTKKDAGIIIPPQDVNVVEIDFDQEKYPDQWRIMQQLNKYAEIKLTSGDTISMMEVIALITRKRQANVYPGGIKIWETIRDDEGKVIGKNLVFDVGDEVSESIKLDYGFDHIKDVTADGDKSRGERVVVFSQFNDPLIVLGQRLNDAGISAVTMLGETDQATREDIQLDFDRTTASESEYKHQVLLTNYRTGGTGINLTAATQVLVLDEPWNPGTFEQALDRLNRIGQTRDQSVTILRIAGSIDDWLADLIDMKKEIVDGFETSGRELSMSLLEALESGKIV